jgi:hypothetical protein
MRSLPSAPGVLARSDRRVHLMPRSRTCAHLGVSIALVLGLGGA